MRVLPRKYEITIVGNDSTVYTYHAPLVQMHSVDIGVLAPEVGRASFSIITGTTTSDVSGVSQQFANFSDVQTLAENIRGAWVKFAVATNEDSTTGQFATSTGDTSGNAGLGEPTYQMQWLGKIFDVVFATGNTRGELLCSCIEFTGWLDTQHLNIVPQAYSTGVTFAGPLWRPNLPHYNHVIKDKMTQNRMNDGNASIQTETGATIVMEAFASCPAGPTNDASQFYSYWTKKNIHDNLMAYVSSVNAALFTLTGISIGALADNTGNAAPEIETVDTMPSIWQILCSLFPRTKGVILKTVYTDSGGGNIQVNFQVENLENNTVGNYAPNSLAFDFNVANYADFYAHLNQAPKLSWYQPYKGKKVVVQTGPVSFITTVEFFRMQRNWTDAAQELLEANPHLLKANSQYDAVGASFYLDPTLYEIYDPREVFANSIKTLGYIPDPPRGDFRLVLNTSAGTPYIDNPFPLSGASLPNMQTTRFSTEIDTTIFSGAYNFQNRLSPTTTEAFLFEGIVFKDDVGYHEEGTFKKSKHTIKNISGLTINISRDSGAGYSRFFHEDTPDVYQPKLFGTVKIENLPPFYYSEDTSFTNQGDDVVFITLDKHIRVIDVNAVVAISGNDGASQGHCFCYNDYVTGGPDRFVILDDINTPINLVNQMKSMISLFKTPRIKCDLSSAGIWLINDKVGAFLKTQSVPDNVITSATNTSYTSIDSNYASITPNSVISKIIWDFDSNQTIIITDYKNYGQG